MPRLDPDWRRQHVASGGCSNCKRPAVPGQSLCTSCRDSSNASHRRLRRELATQNRCRECRAPATHGVHCARCAEQNRERASRYYRANLTIQRIKARAQRFGLTVEQVTQLLDRGACDICGGTERLHIDHCHATNTVRGLLCDHCNNMLGRAKDRPDILRRGAEYLEATKCGTTTSSS